MELTVIGSSSAGNAYLLENDQEALLLECGVHVDKIKQALRFNLSKLRGVLVTHEHGDHAKSVKAIQKAGIDVYASFGTHAAIGTIDSHRSICVKAGQQFKVGSFTVKAFDLQHDVREPLGFLIHHPETGRILFLTDSYYSEYLFTGLNNVIIEANHAQDIMDSNVMEGSLHRSLRDRTMRSHMSLDTCKKFLYSSDLSAVNNIVLIHLSDSNSDAVRFKREIEETTGKLVHVAKAGLTIPFNKKPF